MLTAGVADAVAMAAMAAMEQRADAAGMEMTASSGLWAATEETVAVVAMVAVVATAGMAEASWSSVVSTIRPIAIRWMRTVARADLEELADSVAPAAMAAIKVPRPGCSHRAATARSLEFRHPTGHLALRELLAQADQQATEDLLRF